MSQNMPHSGSVNTKKAAAKFRKDAATFTTKVTATKEIARKTLVELGIYTQTGKLSKNYKK